MVASLESRVIEGSPVHRHFRFFSGIFDTPEKISAYNSIHHPQTGHTQLIRAGESTLEFLARHGVTGLNLFYRAEQYNPSHSFKDAGMEIAVALGLVEGAEAFICSSTGNTSASAALFGRRAGKPVYVVVAEDVSGEKLRHTQVYGAQVIRHGRHFNEAFAYSRRIACLDRRIVMVNSTNPHRLEGQRVAAFDIVGELGSAPDYVFIPVGNALNISAYEQGFHEMLEAGEIKNRPVMVGGRAVVGNTSAKAIDIMVPENMDRAVRAVQRSDGTIINGIHDEWLWAAHEVLLSEGIFVELASAMSLALIPHYARQRKIQEGSAAVAVLTGNGLKDIAINGSPAIGRIRPYSSGQFEAELRDRFGIVAGKAL